jgi:hypothetical protein
MSSSIRSSLPGTPGLRERRSSGVSATAVKRVAVLFCSASFLKEDRNEDHGDRERRKEMKIPVKGVGDRDAKKP